MYWLLISFFLCIFLSIWYRFELRNMTSKNTEYYVLKVKYYSSIVFAILSILFLITATLF